MVRRFRDRTEAGRVLATKLSAYANRSDVLVLGLPRGGVPVAFEVAAALHSSLVVFVVRKLGLPGQEELAMGAIATGGLRVLNEALVENLNIPEGVIDSASRVELKELERREQLYRGERPPLEVGGCVVILIDDGLATGSTMRAAVLALRQRQPARIVVAVPVAPLKTVIDFQTVADEIICLATPEWFDAVGSWYDDFSQITDEAVRDLLQRAANQAFAA
jgi:putative phosphoribosyl transferase